MTSHVRRETANGVLTLTLDRPDKKNALTREMYRALSEAIEGADADPEVRCVLIQAEGDMFTAGNDLAAFVELSEGRGHELDIPLLQTLARARTPLVAAVNGRAVGIGVTLLLHCDLVYLAQDAQLRMPFVDLGVIPEAASTLTLPARIGHVRAFELFMGAPLDAATAVAWGLANAAVPADELRTRARAAAELVASKPAESVRLTKALMRDAEALSARTAEEAACFVERLQSPEARAALTAFMSRRG
jgi:enoyl-CoA hydratase/carnithine racemase